MDNLVSSKNFQSNYFKVFGLKFPDMDTVAMILQSIAEDDLELIKTEMISELIERKVFDKWRYEGYAIVAVDGTGLMSFHQKRHCEHCLVKTSSKGVVTYFHNVLEAKLVTSNGFSISLCSEWIQNPNLEYKKQDCEQKAFTRLSEKLKKSFPRLKIGCSCNLM